MDIVLDNVYELWRIRKRYKNIAILYGREEVNSLIRHGIKFEMSYDKKDSALNCDLEIGLVITIDFYRFEAERATERWSMTLFMLQVAIQFTVLWWFFFIGNGDTMNLLFLEFLVSF